MRSFLTSGCSMAAAAAIGLGLSAGIMLWPESHGQPVNNHDGIVNHRVNQVGPTDRVLRQASRVATQMTVTEASKIGQHERGPIVNALQSRDVKALRQALDVAYGQDSSIDSLLVEAARLLASLAPAQHGHLAADKLQLFLAFELAKANEGQSAPGAMIHLVEAIAEVPTELSRKDLLMVLDNPQLERPVRAAAAMALASMNESSLRGSVETFVMDLELYVSQSEPSQDELPFVLDTITEMKTLLAKIP